jgi:hypothetical protein
VKTTPHSNEHVCIDRPNPGQGREWGEAWALEMWVYNDLVYLVGGEGGVRFMMSISRSGG